MAIEDNALSSFLSSSLNVELVYTLLESITTFLKKSDNQDALGFVIREKNKAAKSKAWQPAAITPIDLTASDESLAKQVES
jgi:hypothetical protein